MRLHIEPCIVCLRTPNGAVKKGWFWKYWEFACSGEPVVCDHFEDHIAHFIGVTGDTEEAALTQWNVAMIRARARAEMTTLDRMASGLDK